ncbi:MAG: glycosyltransferase family 2 protein [Desulfomonilaceae bacterium]
MANCDQKAPIAFMIFNRPDTTAEVFAEIAKARPNKLLVVADGPRVDHPADHEKCLQARAIIDQVDWECEVHKNYSPVNLGCKRRVSSGLDWVFDTVERAIVLEDDVVPHPTFFRFCDELLDKYAEDERVGAICGCNFQDGHRHDGYSYYFSRYNYVWGWASWARAWKLYDVNMQLWPEVRDGRYLKSMVPDEKCLQFWLTELQRVYDGQIDTWDYQWTFACWTNNMLAIHPRVNLVSNIGFGLEATHTKDAESFAAARVLAALALPLSHPPFVMRDERADAFSDKQWGRFQDGLRRKIRRAAELARQGKWRLLVLKIVRRLKTVTASLRKKDWSNPFRTD